MVDVEQSVIGGGNDCRLHSGYEAESREDCNVSSPVGVEKDTPVVLQDASAQLEQSQHPVAVWCSSTVR